VKTVPPASMQDTPGEEDELCQSHIRSIKRAIGNQYCIRLPDAADILAHQRQLLADPDFDPTCSQIVDCTALPESI